MTRLLLALKMVIRNETETSASSPVHAQTRSILEDHDSGRNFNPHVFLKD